MSRKFKDIQTGDAVTVSAIQARSLSTAAPAELSSGKTWALVLGVVTASLYFGKKLGRNTHSSDFTPQPSKAVVPPKALPLTPPLAESAPVLEKTSDKPPEKPAHRIRDAAGAVARLGWQAVVKWAQPLSPQLEQAGIHLFQNGQALMNAAALFKEEVSGLPPKAQENAFARWGAAFQHLEQILPALVGFVQALPLRTAPAPMPALEGESTEARLTRALDGVREGFAQVIGSLPEGDPRWVEAKAGLAHFSLIKPADPLPPESPAPEAEAAPEALNGKSTYPDRVDRAISALTELKSSTPKKSEARQQIKSALKILQTLSQNVAPEGSAVASTPS